MRLIEEAFLPKEAWRIGYASLWARRASPFPINLTEFEMRRNTELLWIVIRLYGVSHNDFSSKGSLLLVIEHLDLLTNVLIAELVYDLMGSHSELSEEN